MRGRFLAAAALAVLCAAGAAAQDADKVCRAFCDVDAKACRKDAQDKAARENDPLIDADFGRPYKDDLSTEKKQAAASKTQADRQARSTACGHARMACVQRCAVPTSGPATLR